MSQNIKYGDGLSKYYPFFLTLIGGFGAAFALIGLVMTVGGGSHAGMILGGLVVLIVCQLPALRQAANQVAEAKEAGMPESEYKKLGPVPVFVRLTLVGLGKVGHILLTCTIIGIPLYRSMVNMQNTVDAYCAQIDLREQLEVLKEAKKQAAVAEAESKAAGKNAAPVKNAVPAKTTAKAEPKQAKTVQPKTAPKVEKAAQPTQSAQAVKAEKTAQPAQEQRKAQASVNQEGLDAQGCYDLAMRYITGDGVENDLNKACECLVKAADGGIGNANFYLGHILFTQGAAVDVNAPDFQKQLTNLFVGGATFFAKAIEKADLFTVESTVKTIAGVDETSYNSGDIRGVFGYAMESQYERLIQTLTDRTDAASDYALGQMCMYGVGVEQDYEAARKWFEAGAAKGLKEAEKMLENPIFSEDEEDE